MSVLFHQKSDQLLNSYLRKEENDAVEVNAVDDDTNQVHAEEEIKQFENDQDCFILSCEQCPDIAWFFTKFWNKLHEVDTVLVPGCSSRWLINCSWSCSHFPPFLPRHRHGRL